VLKICFVFACTIGAYANLQREIAAMQLINGHPHTVGVKEVLLDVSKPKKRHPGQFVSCILLVSCQADEVSSIATAMC
jgi:hypothetical protein